MIVMPGDNTGFRCGYVAGRFPGRIALLLNVKTWKSPVPEVDYSIDNGAYTGFDEVKFLSAIEKAKRNKRPRWIVCPDVVGDRSATLRLWDEWHPRLKELGWPIAMAMQDGMTPKDFNGDIAFIGGTTRWKWRNLKMWMDVPRFHVGRVNTYRHLWQAHECGAESCDGTGWFRSPSERLPGLLRYLKESSDKNFRHMPRLFVDAACQPSVNVEMP